MTPDDEEWRPIVGYEGLYEVSSHGRVRALDRWVWDRRGFKRPKHGHIMSQAANQSNGYYQLSLSSNGYRRSRFVHQIVLEAFHGPSPSPEMVCCHTDGNRLNNTPENLRWDTPTNNNLDKTLHGRTTANWTHCSKGHEYTPENTGRFPSLPTSRVCRMCSWIRSTVHFYRKRELTGALIKYVPPDSNTIAS